MSGEAEAAPPPWYRPDPSIAAFVVPAVLLSLLDEGGAGIVVLTVLLAAGTVLIRHPRLPKLAALGELPLALAVLAVPAASSPASWPLALLAGAGGLGLLVWLGRTSGVPGGTGRLVTALWVPVLAFALAAGIALSAPEISGSPGLAALLVLVALLVFAFLVAAPDRPAKLPGRAPASSADGASP